MSKASTDSVQGSLRGRPRCGVLRSKTDRADAAALLEAHRNERILSVPVKSLAQQALAGLHRLRSASMADRVARINVVRGLLRELGLTIPVGARHVVVQALAQLEKLPEPLRPALSAACEEIREFEARIAAVEKQLRVLAKQTPVVERLQTIPGVGLLTATALVALVGDVERYEAIGCSATASPRANALAPL